MSPVMQVLEKHNTRQYPELYWNMGRNRTLHQKTNAEFSLKVHRPIYGAAIRIHILHI